MCTEIAPRFLAEPKRMLNRNELANHALTDIKLIQFNLFVYSTA
jgi:hypothetical protein